MARDTSKKRKLRRVLLVEDDAVLALTLEGALLDAGADEVVICSTMAATVVELERNPPDTIILDVHLADRDDGWALAEVVSLLGPNRPRIAFATGSAADIPPAVKAMGPVFEKPYDPQQVAEVLLSEKKTGLFARIRGALG